MRLARRFFAYCLGVAAVMILLPITSVSAQGALCSIPIINSIEVDATLESGSVLRLTLPQSGASVPIYRSGPNYYWKQAGANLRIIDVGRVKVNVNKNFLDQLGEGSSFWEDANINFHQEGACEDEREETEKLKKQTDPSFIFNYTAARDDMACMFGSAIAMQYRQSQAGSNIACSQAYAFQVKDLSEESGNLCKLTMTPSTGVTATDTIIIGGEDIDDKGEGIRVFLNGEDVSIVDWKAADPHPRNAQGLISFFYTTDPLSVDDYRFLVKTEETQETICGLDFSVAARGATPTPPQQLSPEAAETAPGTIQVAQPIPLCQSIPSDADCGGESCMVKCTQCEAQNGIWTGVGCLPTNAQGLVSAIFEIFSGILGAFILICVVLNGLKVMTSRGDAEKLKKAREAITSCVVGFLVLVFSVLFLKIVGVDILQIPGFG